MYVRSTTEPDLPVSWLACIGRDRGGRMERVEILVGTPADAANRQLQELVNRLEGR